MRTVIVTGFVLLLGLTAAIVAGDKLPPELAVAALARYPQWLRCQMARASDPRIALDVDPSVPISEDVQRGWLQARIGTLSPSGPQVAVVVYKRFAHDQRLNVEDFLRIFVYDGTHWVIAPLAGQATWVLAHSCRYWIDPSRNPDAPPTPESVVFADVDGDGVKEILLYGETPGPYRKWESIVVLAYRNGQLVPLTGLDLDMEPFDSVGPPECTTSEPTFSPKDEFVSENGAGFVDMDGDGIDELLVYPKLGGDRPAGDPQQGRYYDVPTTGTRVYKLVNGVYTFQYETPIGTSGMPAIGAAIKPASVEAKELEAIAKEWEKEKGKGDEEHDQSLALYVMPPAKVTLDDVDWTTFRIADFKIAATADRGVSPAPPAPDPEAGWIPFGFMGRPMWLEELKEKDELELEQHDKDPMVYMGAKGRLHMTTSYRELRFAKKPVFAWLWAQWQKGSGNQELKACVTHEKEQHCITPLSLPIKADLTKVGGKPRGFALGEALIWVETKEKADGDKSAPAAKTAATPSSHPAP